MITHELFRHSPNKRTDKENDSPLRYAKNDSEIEKKTDTGKKDFQKHGDKHMTLKIYLPNTPPFS